MHLHTSLTQKFAIATAFLLTTGIVLSIPLLLIQQFIYTNNFINQEPYSKSNQAIANANPTPMPSVTKAIFPPMGQIMTGVSMPGDNADTIDNFEKDAGKNVSVILLYQAWGATDGTQNFPADWAGSVRKHGAIPLITWEPWVHQDYPKGINEPNYTLKNIIAGKFDNYIRQWSNAAKAWKNPFFLRFAPEMNGNWTPWSEGLNGNKTGEFVQAWKHVHDIFTADGTMNAIWTWCPNINYPGSLPLSEFYPGDAYVDWTAMDGFNRGTATKNSAWFTFSQVFSSTYNDILKITTKPMMIAETGCVEQGGNKAAWITDAYSVELPKYFSAVKAIVWFNQITQEDWRIESSSAALAAFSTAIRAPIYASNTFGDKVKSSSVL